MSEGRVRSRRSAEVSGAEPKIQRVAGEVPAVPEEEPRALAVVGEGSVAALLREQLGGRGQERLPALVPGRRARFLVGVRTLVVVVPAAEFGPRAARDTARDRTDRTRREDLVAEAQRVAEAAVVHGVEQLVVVTSAMVHGATRGRAVIEDEEPLPPDPAGFAGDLVAIEDALRAHADGVRVAVLRPAVVVGPGVDTILSRHFEAPRLLTVRGSDRDWQFVHVEDLASAVALVAEQRLEGAFTVGALADGEPDTIGAAQLSELSGLRTVNLPEATALGAAERLYRVGALPSPATDLAFVVHPWTVSARRLHDAGWEPRWSSAQCLEVLLAEVAGRTALAGRRVGGRDAAALGAAGAAVALLGTAAIWRQARRR